MHKNSAAPLLTGFLYIASLSPLRFSFPHFLQFTLFLSESSAYLFYIYAIPHGRNAPCGRVIIYLFFYKLAAVNAAVVRLKSDCAALGKYAFVLSVVAIMEGKSEAARIRKTYVKELERHFRGVIA